MTSLTVNYGSSELIDLLNKQNQFVSVILKESTPFSHCLEHFSILSVATHQWYRCEGSDACYRPCKHPLKE